MGRSCWALAFLWLASPAWAEHNEVVAILWGGYDGRLGPHGALSVVAARDGGETRPMWVFHAEVGDKGASLSVGRAVWAPPYFGLGDIGVGFPLGTLGVNVDLVRPWDSVLGEARHRALVGADVEYTLGQAVRLKVGLLTPLAAPGSRVVVTWGVGLGLPFPIH